MLTIGRDANTVGEQYYGSTAVVQLKVVARLGDQICATDASSS
jgi:hypothetical protein